MAPTSATSTGSPAGLRARLLAPRALAVVALAVLTFVVAQSCQKAQVRITKEQAIATAERRVGFEPRRTQIRMIRQGLRSHPVWAVSLSVPGRAEGEFERLAVVRVDANTGKVLGVAKER